MEFYSYFRVFICSVIVSMALVIGINFGADPFGFYHDGVPWDWVHKRMGIPHYMYAYKAHMVEKLKPEVLLLGSSRVLYGLDPENPALPKDSYNLGLEDASLYVQWRYLQHSAETQMPKMVILGMDIQSFNALLKPTSSFSEDRLSVTPEGKRNPYHTFADSADTLMSTKALYYSLKPIISDQAQFDYPKGYNPDFMIKSNHMNLARNIEVTNLQWLKSDDNTHYVEPNGRQPGMDAFQNMIFFCAQHNIRFVVFINPLHMSMTDLVTANWNNYSNWMKTVVGKLNSVSGSDNELWDFTGYSNMSTESFPLPTDMYSHMHFYYDCSHYQQNVGDLILSRILTENAPSDFGQKVTMNNVQDDLDRIMREKNAWHQNGQAKFVAR
jgi:hypothetical protein